MEKVPMTAAGFSRLEKELQRLRHNDRPEVIKAIAEAREHGDLSENAEYHAARERQGFIEGRIADLEDKISRADVIDIAKLKGTKEIKFGATVTLADEDTNEEFTYQIVGNEEADINAGRLSVNAPLARALINKRQGDVVENKTPRGNRSFEVLKVEYIE